MHEVQKPKKPLYYYYGVALLILMCFNLLAMPYMAEKQVKNIDYGTFMTMTENKEIGRVEIQSNQIIFTDKDEKNIYKTGPLNDPGLIIKQMSPLLNILLSWIIPIGIFFLIGQYMSKKMMDRNGNFMSFGMGKSNAKIYVKSSEGIKFSDVAGEDDSPR